MSLISESQRAKMDRLNPTVEDARTRADEHEAAARNLRRDADRLIANAARQERWAVRWRVWANEKVDS